MILITVVTGIVLIVLGVPFFLLQFAGDDGKVSWTPFIPAIFGLLFLLAGWLASAWPGWRKHVMHVALLLGVLVALAGLGMGLPGVGRMIAGGEIERPLAAIEQLIMGLVGLGFVALGVRSFIAARRARTPAAPSSQDVPEK